MEEKMTSMLELLLEERKLERIRRDEEQKQREEERKQREEERKRQGEQLEAIYKLVEKTTDLTSAAVSTGTKSTGSLGGGSSIQEDKLQLAKLTDGDDVEAFLTTFERLMETYGVEENRWAYKLAPQLTGKAQQAYAALPNEEAKKYEDVKRAILLRYDINAETY